MSKIWGESPLIRSYRELLGVQDSFSADDLKKAFRSRVKLYHPDINPSPDARIEFEKVKTAYEVLKSPIMVAHKNVSFVQESLLNRCVKNLNICFGSLFGYRHFLNEGQGLIKRKFRLGSENSDEKDLYSEENLFIPLQEDNSILDFPAFDSIELVYAGKHSISDEKLLRENMTTKGSLNLPWVVLNNQGIINFLNCDYKKALKAYNELNHRIPNNIIFMYREAICRAVVAFDCPQLTFMGVKKPNRIEIEKSCKQLLACLNLGANRSVGKQKALVIRKTLAELYQKSGQKRKAKKLWQEIFSMDNNSVEATYNLKGRKAALELLAVKVKKVQKMKTTKGINSKLIPS